MKEFNYDFLAEHYDALDLDAETWGEYYEEHNSYIDNLFKVAGVKTVLDLTCGTGLQSVYLAQRGYLIKANDSSKEMLKVARKKAKELPNITFSHKNLLDMPEKEYDAVISSFNSLSHLKQTKFNVAMKKVFRMLASDGLFVFDIFNTGYLLSMVEQGYWFIDSMSEKDDQKVVRHMYNSINQKTGVLSTKIRLCEQQGIQETVVTETYFDRISYTKRDLVELLERTGFEVLEVTDIDGSKFNDKSSEYISVIARKV